LAVDITGNTASGTYTGGVTQQVPGALLNDNDTAITLDGTSGYVLTGFTQTAVTSYTLEAWVKTTATTSNNGVTGRVVFQDRGAGSGLSLTLVMITSGTADPAGAGAMVWGLDTNSQEAWDSGTVVNDGAWHYIVSTFSASSGTPIECGPNNNTWIAYTNGNCGLFQLYVDGASVSTLANSQTVSASSPLTGSGPALIGYHQTWGVYWLGSLDEVAAYNYALTPAQVAAHYHAAGY
jgi:hypothetical protein